MASKDTVLIIGAGIAGLAAGQALQAQGFEVTVLEARDRIGGRIWSVRDWEGVTLDLGAEWIVGTDGNPLVALAQQLGLNVFQTDWYSLALYSAAGKRATHTNQRLLEDQLNAVLAAARAQRLRDRAAGMPDRSLRAAVDDVLAAMNLTPDERAELDFVISTDVEHEFAADLSDLSVYHWDEEGRLGGGELVFPGGYDQIIPHFAAQLDIRTGHVVERIATDARGVTVATNHGMFSADQCLVSVPLGVLRQGSITFTPELPEAKRAAIHNLHVGLLNKTFLRFPHVFWPDEHVLGRLAERRGVWPWFVNLFPSTGSPALIGLNAGAFAQQLEALSDEDVAAAMMDALRQMFGPDIPDPIAWRMTRWEADPFARGSYSHIPPGASPDDYEALAQPVDDRLFFAGEATALRYAGTVHGAYFSGLREAERIARRSIPS